MRMLSWVNLRKCIGIVVKNRENILRWFGYCMIRGCESDYRGKERNEKTKEQIERQYTDRI